MPDSPFRFLNTAPSRTRTTDLSNRLKNEVVAIVGVGGTGSYVLDFVSKTEVKEIHLFDNDEFLNHNAIRAPGPFGKEELAQAARKAVFHAARYSRMRSSIFAHDDLIDESNVDRLRGFDTVFMCLAAHPIKRMIAETCVRSGGLVIDTGMSVDRGRQGGPLLAMLATTTLTQEHYAHMEGCVDMAVDDDDGEYGARNAQMAELNAMNAAFAVIRWKKERGLL